MSLFKPFYTQAFLLFALILGVALSVLELSPIVSIGVVTALLLLHSVVYFVLEQRIKGKPQAFVTAFMGAMGAKLFITLMALVMVVLLVPTIPVKAFVMLVFISYMAFSMLETLHLLKLNRSV